MKVGAKRLSDVTKILVPVMGVIYVGVALVVILMNIRTFHVSRLFLLNAFDFKQSSVEFTGSCIMFGVRGLYSNEAGMGSAQYNLAYLTVTEVVCLQMSYIIYDYISYIKHLLYMYSVDISLTLDQQSYGIHVQYNKYHYLDIIITMVVSLYYH